MPRSRTPSQPSSRTSTRARSNASVDAFDLETFLPFQLSVVANRVSQTVGQSIASRFSLQIPEWRIVVVLGKYGALSALEIAQKTSMDKARVSRAQHRLVDLGLANMHPSVEDRRKVIVSLEEEGLALYRDMVPLAHDTAQRLFAQLTPDEQQVLQTIVQKLFDSTTGFEPSGELE
ncbi:MarR family winged helix-turn-helix transcriptional regulator [Variovorax sp. NFACC27]|uniref:MarR family winged helix-turn-helix transcriptional regulator n=1 Tax=unclassified Variovorax TaxID=663243 RepID=UPI00089B4B45|nr:DNA-binding MarR family transcriptional regulator [Variovorax paradoxus]SEF25989.1 DNA-binding transcriptional regulator, MarR family [Variovorax sp. NFACC28]SEG51247.1 DNA-binding transcriptional regulator, MarR family [Variovorax sp. NFACC29]SFC19583.1 DNA-binding transcriptional regulator, MarR family [Variovorax sp. NFACC26]SFH01041.1 DNA-binding transcriptional regulator, MarR family [Variovorax sp. NFACC27]